MDDDNRVVIGMDPHKRSVTIEVMTGDEQVLGGGRFATDVEGFTAMLAYVAAWPNRVWAIEGCEGIGRHVAQRLLAQGESVVDVPAKLSARVRVFATGQGRKTDDTDAHSIALVGVRMNGLRAVVDDEQLELLRLLVDRRRRLGEEHTRMVCQLHQLLLELIPGGAKRDLSAAQARKLLASVRPRDVVGKTRKQHAMELVVDLERIYQRKKAANKELIELIKSTGTGLLDLHGIGPSGAARLLVEVGDITRFPDRGHFASWTGTAPIDASSGDRVRHRLSRGGNRQINVVLHIMATVQLRNPTEGRAYYDRKIAAGKSSNEAMRCLIGGVSGARPGRTSGRGSRSCRGMASLPCPVRASLSSATPGAPRPPTGVRNKPDRGPNNEEPAKGLDTDESTIDSIRRPEMPFVGWDWASRTHDVTVLDDDGAIQERWSFPHTEPGWADTLHRLHDHGDPSGLPVIIEKSSGLVIERLLAAGHPVVPVHPTSFYAARPRWGASGAKSDPGDSYKLADYLRTDGHRLRRLEPVDPGLQELQALVRLRDDQVRARTAAVNQLTATLDAHWPGPRHLFRSLASRIALAFLTDYPTPAAARHLGEGRMAAFCRRHSYRGGKSAAELLARLRSAPVTAAGLPEQTVRIMVDTQIAVVRALQAAITDVEATIAVRVASHPRARLLERLPGVGTINLAQLLAEVGPILDRVDNAEQAATECGAAPVTKASGKTTGVYFRWAANTRARKAITAFAHNARMQSPWAGRLYADARARGKRNPHATRIVARAWIRVIWACWHTGTAYDPALHQAHQQALHLRT